MFRILLIIGLLFSCAQQGLARGKVDLSAQKLPVVLAVDAVSGIECCGENTVPAPKRPHCISDCKAVIAVSSAEPPNADQDLDGAFSVKPPSILHRLEPRPPKS